MSPFYRRLKVETFRCARSRYEIESAVLVKWFEGEKQPVVSCKRRDLPGGDCEVVIERWVTRYFPADDEEG